jgi:hypothetical protein
LPAANAKPRANFFTYLLAQRHRTDNVGILVARRFAKEGGRRWSYFGLIDHLFCAPDVPADDHDFLALRRAWAEYLDTRRRTTERPQPSLGGAA